MNSVRLIDCDPFLIKRIFIYGAGERIRTVDPNLGKVMLYPWATPAPQQPFKKSLIRKWNEIIAKKYFNVKRKPCFYDKKIIYSALFEYESAIIIQIILKVLNNEKWWNKTGVQ